LVEVPTGTASQGKISQLLLEISKIAAASLHAVQSHKSAVSHDSYLKRIGKQQSRIYSKAAQLDCA
jgi:hypothetical protein